MSDKFISLTLDETPNLYGFDQRNEVRKAIEATAKDGKMRSVWRKVATVYGKAPEEQPFSTTVVYE